MIVFDATMVMLLMRSDVDPPIDPATGERVEHAQARLTGLVTELEKQKSKIIIPTPALSELLVRAGNSAQELIKTIQESSVLSIKPFDTLAAIEVSTMTSQALAQGDKRSGTDATWAKVKYDRQIIAIAKVHRATEIYSDDKDIFTLAQSAKIQVKRLVDIPIPNEAAQALLPNLEVNND